MQCGKEYGFSSNKTTKYEVTDISVLSPRATDISILSSSSFEGLPTNNLPAERNV